MAGLNHRSSSRRAATIILDAFQEYRARFAAITRRARVSFEQRDWRVGQLLSATRLDLYPEIVGSALDRLRPLLASRLTDRDLWGSVRPVFAGLLQGRPDAELAETFFNSTTRRIFHTIGLDPAVEFVAPAAGGNGAEGARAFPPGGLTVTVPRNGTLVDLVADVLRQFPFEIGYRSLETDASLSARAIASRVGDFAIASAELARPVFFRGKGAYLVGRLHGEGGAGRTERTIPFLIALTNPGGVEVDAVLLTEDEVSIVFSFARAYFLVDVDRPRELVRFLASIMPRKPVAELYNSIGFNKHGKTELYRSLLHHLETADDRFEIAPGQRGMVMCVFTLPGFDVVFKVIRDRFDEPKTVTHQEVRDKYRLVFHHDRAGRLADVQEFEHVQFDRGRFSAPLLRELTTLASERVEVRGDTVVVRHLYTERRLRPLDMYLREADPDSAREAVIDYGQVVRDLAATNIFPGDLLLKNFGVSRHGRLIFYDYDELCALTDCRFRELPAPPTPLEEMAGEPWYYVGGRDIFPEEFRSFLGLKDELLRVFLEAHGELLDVAFWRRMQDLHRRGEVLDIYPYRAARRLRRGA